MINQRKFAQKWKEQHTRFFIQRKKHCSKRVSMNAHVQHGTECVACGARGQHKCDICDTVWLHFRDVHYCMGHCGKCVCEDTQACFEKWTLLRVGCMGVTTRCCDDCMNKGTYDRNLRVTKIFGRVNHK